MGGTHCIVSDCILSADCVMLLAEGARDGPPTVTIGEPSVRVLFGSILTWDDNSHSARGFVAT